jgi:hypothetical protein
MVVHVSLGTVWRHEKVGRIVCVLSYGKRDLYQAMRGPCNGSRADSMSSVRLFEARTDGKSPGVTYKIVIPVGDAPENHSKRHRRSCSVNINSSFKVIA